MQKELVNDSPRWRGNFLSDEIKMNAILDLGAYRSADFQSSDLPMQYVLYRHDPTIFQIVL